MKGNCMQCTRKKENPARYERACGRAKDERRDIMCTGPPKRREKKKKLPPPVLVVAMIHPRAAHDKVF